MGITGLLPFLKNSCSPTHVREFSGQTAAVDVYCWLHKGAFGCAEKLVQGQRTDGFIWYVMKYVNLLLDHDIKPILVFDGRNLPSKSGTEKKRRENRAKYRHMAKNYLKDGRNREARECFQKCVDITPEMAREVIQACQERNIDCVIAPYEADAQLACLNQRGYADFIISEDSDLTLFGCDKILFKLDITGRGMLYEKSKLHLCLGMKADRFNFEKFRYMGILSGCDYLPSPPGIGLAKSFKFWSRVTNMNLKQVLPKIPSYLNMPQVSITSEYIEGFIRANNTFLYQMVFDVKKRKITPLNEYPVMDHLDDLDYAGSQLEDDVAIMFALGNLDIYTLDQVHDFDPDKSQYSSSKKKTAFGKKCSYQSIWSQNYSKRDPLTKKSTMETTVDTAFGKVQRFKRKYPETSSEKCSIHSIPDSDEENEEEITLNYQVKAKKPKVDLKLDANRKSQSPPKVDISKYFVKKPKPDLKLDANTRSKSPPKVYISKYFANSRTEKNKGSSWFSALDKEHSLEDKYIFRSDFQYDQPSAKQVINPLKASEGIRVSKAAQQAFKPVMPSKFNSGETPRNEDEHRLKRNPFAVKKS